MTCHTARIFRAGESLESCRGSSHDTEVICKLRMGSGIWHARRGAVALRNKVVSYNRLICFLAGLPVHNYIYGSCACMVGAHSNGLTCRFLVELFHQRMRLGTRARSEPCARFTSPLRRENVISSSLATEEFTNDLQKKKKKKRVRYTPFACLNNMDTAILTGLS